MSIVLDPGRKVSFLLLLDGGSFKELARVDAPQLIPFKFHGNFYIS
jgi:carotenoid cleavage dioxygenase-like enzyme